MGYKHLTRAQRYTIEALLQTPMSLREIGEVIGVSTGTVSREIRRNCDMRGYHRYRWHLAQKKYERRMKARRHYLKFTDEMKRTVRRFIIYGQYSPEQICGRFRLKGEEIVCAETIYRWIWQEKRHGNDHEYSYMGYSGTYWSATSGDDYESGYTFIFSHRYYNEHEEDYYWGAPIRAVFSID